MHHTIHRHTLTGAQAQDIPNNNLFNGALHKFSRPAHLRGFHAQTQKTLNGLSRAPFGAIFEITAKKDQDHNQARRFIIYARNPFGQNLRQKGGDE